MNKEYLIGRSPSSAIAIPDDKTSVSRQHIKITISDNGVWELEDLSSTNGTYCKDENGVFKKVYKKAISENTVIRLGNEGHCSFIFTARRVVNPDAPYAYEFNQLRKELKQIILEEEIIEKRNTRNMKIVKAASPLAMVLCIILQFVIPGLNDNTNANLWLSRISMSIAPLVIGLFFGIDTQKIKMLKQKRIRILTCPKCGYPVSETDIQQMQCSRCKAK